MVNGNGTITFNGLTDKEFIMALQVKEKHEVFLDFPNQAVSQQQAGNARFYATLKFDWKGNEGLKAVFQIIEGLLEEKKHDQQP